MGFPPAATGNPKHDRYWYSAAIARAYAEGSGRDLVRDTLLMCANEKGRERERQAAINRYGAMSRRQSVPGESALVGAGVPLSPPGAVVSSAPTSVQGAARTELNLPKQSSCVAWAKAVPSPQGRPW